MGAQQSNNKPSQQLMNSCKKSKSFALDPKNNCCSLIKNPNIRKKVCNEINLKAVGYERWYDLFKHYSDELINQYSKENFIGEKESFIEGYDAYLTKLSNDNTAIAKNKFNALKSSLKTQGHEKAAKEAAKAAAEEEKAAKEKATKAKDEAIKAKNAATEAGKAKTEASNIKDETNNLKYETNDLKDQTNDLKDKAENNVTTINQRVNDTNDLVDDTREILHTGVGELMGAENISNKQMDFNQNLSAYAEEKIDSAIARLESFIGSKKEGFSRKEIYDLLGFLKTKEQTESVALQQSINERLEQTTNDRTSELLLQKDNILTRLISDYMINGETGTNVEKVYEDLKQKNNDELRKIQIKSYYNKAYKEYIFILKVVICLIVLLIPIIFLNKYEYIDNNKTLMSVVFIITVGVLFISYRLYLLYLKDDIDYDRIRVPYDRQSGELIKQGKMKSKGSVFKNLGVTCIGDECCDVSMVYDNLNNKCILSENFGGYFESMQNKNKEEINIIEPYKVENFTTIENLSHTKEGLLRESLVKSTNTRF